MVKDGWELFKTAEGKGKWVRAGLVGGAPGREDLASGPLSDSATIIKMQRLKGDIPNLRLFVSIKCVSWERRRPYKTNTLWVEVVGGEGWLGKWKFYPLY